MKILLVILMAAFFAQEVVSVPVPDTNSVSDFMRNIANEVKNTFRNLFNSIKDGFRNAFNASKEAARSALNTTTDFFKDIQDKIKNGVQRVAANFNICLDSLKNRFGAFKNTEAKPKADEVEGKIEAAVLATKQDFDKLELDVKESLEKLRSHSQSTIDTTVEQLYDQLKLLADKYQDDTPNVVNCTDTYSPEFNAILTGFTENLQKCYIDTEDVSKTISEEVSSLSGRLSTTLNDILNLVQPCLNSRSSEVTIIEGCLEDSLNSSNSLLDTVREDMKTIEVRAENLRTTAESNIAECSQLVFELGSNQVSQMDNKMQICIS